MKLFKYMACGLLMAGSLTVFTACDDDNNLGEAPRLFSPVVTASANANSLVCTWQGIKGATSYVLTLQRALPNPNEDGSVAVVDVETVTVNVDPSGLEMFSPYTFENLEWDERYRVAIKAVGTDKESKIYTTDLTTLTYPTKLKAVNTTIDTGARIEWNEDMSTSEWADIAYFNVFICNDDGTVTPWVRETADEPAEPEATSRADDEVEKDPIVAPEPNGDYYYTVTADDIKESFAIIDELEPSTSYRVIAYDKNGEYRGRRDFKTLASEVYENPDLVYDLRDEDTEELTSSFFEELPDGAVLLLKGGVKYVTNGTPTITGNITIKTGMSLMGKATISSGGFATKGDIDNVTFENVKYTCLDGDDKTSNFGGRYLFNHSNEGIIGTLTLENVDVKCMRGLIRTRKDGQRYNNIVINNCTMDSVGGYKVVHLDNANTSIGNLKITNSTFSNTDGIVRANNRDNTNIDGIIVENCTFGYCSNAAPLFMLNKEGNSPNLTFKMDNCVIGGNYIGKKFQGASFNEGVAAAFTNIYATSDLEWDVDDAGNKKAEFTVEVMKETADQIWVAPKDLNFTFTSGALDCSQSGDPRWRVAK